MQNKGMTLIICSVMMVSIFASIAQNVGQTSSSPGGGEGLILSNNSVPTPQIVGQPSSSLGGIGGLANSPWPMFRQNLNHTGVSPYDTSLNPGKLKWSFTTGSIVHSSPAIGIDGTIYIGSYDNNLYAVNPDGTEKWNFMASSGLASSPAIDADGTIYVGSWDKNLYAINPNGIKKWSFASGGAIDSSPAIGPDGTIYVGSYDNKLYAINPDGSQKWNFTTGLNVRTSPAIDSDGTIYIGSLDFKLYAINPNGTEKWNIETGSYVEDSSPAIGPDGTIYVGSRDNKLYAINPNGTVRWTYTTDDEVCSSPAIGSDGTIYFGSQDNKFYAINPNGTEKWSFNTGGWVFSSPAIGSDGTIYVGSCDDNLYAINPDGTMKWNFTAGWYIVSSPAIGSDGTIYVGSHDKQIYAIGTSNISPIANAGPDQTVNESDTVQFDGSSSYDPDGDPGNWLLKADNPSPTWGCAATVLNGEIYYMGGIPCYPIVNPSSVFMKYNPATDSWFNLTDLPAPRSYLGAAATNGKIYTIGGSDGNESTDTVFEFDPITNIWTPKSPMPNPMEAFGIAVVKDRIYVIGGSSTWLSNDSCMNVYEYDPANDSWSVKPDMPTGRSNLACAVLEDKIYAIGGNVYGPIGAVEVYNPSAETWTKKANISIPRSGLCAEALGQKIYAFGGTNVWALPTNMTEVYDPSSDSWAIGPSMREPRVYFGSGVVGSCLYAMGGSYGPLIVALPNSTEEYCVGGGLVYEWDFDAFVDSDGDGITTNDVDATGPTPTHVYGDDGNYTVTLTVIDEQGLSDTDTCNITVLNVNPAVKIESTTMDVEIGLRVAGRKYNDVAMTLYEGGKPIGNISIERMPGSPNDQIAWIPMNFNMTKTHNATVTFTPEDPPKVGANPVWIYIKFKNGSIEKIHHTFNVQQSKKRDSDHWNHVEPWEVDLNAHLIGCQFEVTSHITDPGSDDEVLTYTYGSQTITVTHLNNPPNLDPYPSPEVKPVDIMDTTTLVYGGPGTVTLQVEDDDAGTAIITMEMV